MPTIANEIDSGFFTLIHQLVQRSAERAAGGGTSGPTVFRIAVRRGLTVPPPACFTDIHCQTLTTSAFSFLYPRPPQFTQLVAEFGAMPDVIHVVAEVVACRSVRIDADGELRPDVDDAARTASSAERLRAERTVTLVKDASSTSRAGHAAEAIDEGAEPPIRMVLVECRFTERLSG